MELQNQVQRPAAIKLIDKKNGRIIMDADPKLNVEEAKKMVSWMDEHI